MAVTVLRTPLYQKINGQIRKIYYETGASQVILTNGTDIETALSSLQSAVSAQSSGSVYANIAERDAASVEDLHVGDICWVTDASADPTVNSGAAQYLVQAIESGTVTWLKIAESESLDIVTTWADIQNKPESSVADIDSAVVIVNNLAGHTFSLGQDGNLKFDNQDVGQVYAAYVNMTDEDEGFDAAIAALNLPDGAIITSLAADLNNS